MAMPVTSLMINCAAMQRAVRVERDDTPDTLAARVLEAEHSIYPAALAMLARGDVRMGGDGLAKFRDDAGS